jgi:hypothetical protein
MLGVCRSLVSNLFPLDVQTVTSEYTRHEDYRVLIGPWE